MAGGQADGNGEGRAARLDEQPIDPALHLRAAEGIYHLDHTVEPLLELGRQPGHARRPPGQEDGAEWLVGGGGPEEAERALDLLDDELGDRAEDLLGGGRVGAAGGPPLLQRLGVRRGHPELADERVVVLRPADRHVAGERRAAVLEYVDRGVAGADV